MSKWTPEALRLSGELEALLHEGLGRVAYVDGVDFGLYSESRPGHVYDMTHTPEGIAVHLGEGCEGEPFNGPTGCWHSKDHGWKDKNMTTALTTADNRVPQLIEFSESQLKTIASVICVDSDGHPAPAPFVELFLAGCRQSGLNPFLKQIYAIKLKGKWTMYVGIDGYRVISERSGLDAGMDGPFWSDDGETWHDYPFTDRPKFAKVSVWRKGVPRPYTRICRLSAYDQPTSPRWKDDAPGQLAKCAEALARRTAFPADTAVIPREAVFDEPDDLPYIDGQVVNRETGEVVEPAPAASSAPQHPVAAEVASPANSPAGATEHGDTRTVGALPQRQGWVPTEAPSVMPSAPPPAFDSTAFWLDLRRNRKAQPAAVAAFLECEERELAGHLEDAATRARVREAFPVVVEQPAMT